MGIQTKAIELRINRIAGQLNGIKKMLKEERECSSILLQLSAIRAAVNNLGLEIAKSAVCGLPEVDRKKFESLLKEVSRI